MRASLAGCFDHSVRRTNRNQPSRRSDRITGNEQAYFEIQKFLKALDSYSEHFAQNPGVSFEEHHNALIPVKRNGIGRAKQNGANARKS